MKLSFVVSTYARPTMLPIVLHALAVQTFTNFEVFVTDNSEPETQAINLETTMGMNDFRFTHLNVQKLKLGGCYWTAEWAVENFCTGEFVCFPSDDSYYVPRFAEIMMKAAEFNQWDLVYCNMVYDPRFNGTHYAAIDVAPEHSRIDKTGFILRRSWFEGFPGKSQHGPCQADGELIESLLKRGIKHGKVEDILMVHN